MRFGPARAILNINPVAHLCQTLGLSILTSSRKP